MVKKKTPLDYQECILKALRLGPLWTNQIAKETGLHSGLAHYYLHKLEKEGRIESMRDEGKNKKAVLVKWKIVD